MGFFMIDSIIFGWDKRFHPQNKISGYGLVDIGGRPPSSCKCIGNTKRGPVSCSQRMGILRSLRSQDKVTQGAAYRANICNSILETSSHGSQYYLYHCKTGVWLSLNKVRK
ncbi:hypothetical protein NE237_000806 [Protea cynaroides]|uniref:Uncharacterized protein n=1 Tax=Protea cynaroides TaxID=273540 RepID=A0A9Q0QXH3_9MAGN|nr:hypothetical protein NE237_000806 [Protea cynaroides]